MKFVVDGMQFHLREREKGQDMISPTLPLFSQRPTIDDASAESLPLVRTPQWSIEQFVPLVDAISFQAA